MREASPPSAASRSTPRATPSSSRSRGPATRSSAAVEAQRHHAAHDWPDGHTVRVRMGLHTGEPAVGSEGYLGIDVVRAARLCTVGRGGQVVLSETTRALVGSALPDGVSVHTLGERRLKDIDEPERVFELDIEGAPTPAAPEPDASVNTGGHDPGPVPAPPAPPVPDLDIPALTRRRGRNKPPSSDWESQVRRQHPRACAAQDRGTARDDLLRPRSARRAGREEPGRRRRQARVRVASAASGEAVVTPATDDASAHRVNG